MFQGEQKSFPKELIPLRKGEINKKNDRATPPENVSLHLECSVQSQALLLAYGHSKFHGELMHHHVFQPRFY